MCPNLQFSVLMISRQRILTWNQIMVTAYREIPSFVSAFLIYVSASWRIFNYRHRIMLKSWILVSATCKIHVLSQIIIVKCCFAYSSRPCISLSYRELSWFYVSASDISWNIMSNPCHQAWFAYKSISIRYFTIQYHSWSVVQPVFKNPFFMCEIDL